MGLSHLNECTSCGALVPPAAPDNASDAGDFKCSMCLTREAESSSKTVEGAAPLFSPNQVVVGTLLGGFLGAGIVMSRNERATGSIAKSRKVIIAASVTTVVYSIILILLPQSSILQTLSWLAPCLVMHAVAKSKYDALVEDHLRSGGSQGSWMFVVLAGIISTALTYGAAVLIAIGLAMAGIIKLT